LFHSCWGPARVSVHLLPEDLPLPPDLSAGRGLIVTGAYTGRDTRENGQPKPVGLFIRDGALVNPNLARMDGVLIVGPGPGTPVLHHRTQVPLAGRDYDLTQLRDRRDFVAGELTRQLLDHLLFFCDAEFYASVLAHCFAPFIDYEARS
jgi:hypothetical protein